MTVDLLAPQEVELEDDAPTPVVYRNSYKYRVEAQHTVLIMDFVFADNVDEAEMRARAAFSLDPEERLRVYRVSEGSMGGQRIA